MASAIYLDLENLGISLMKYDDMLVTVREMMEQISTCPLLKERAVLNAYVAFTNPKITMLRNILKDFGIKLIEVIPLDKAPKKPNLVDFKLYADALELAARSRKITTVALASGDNDYGFLCESAKNMGKNFVLITRGEHVSQSIVPLSDDWISIDNDYQRVNIPNLWKCRLPPMILQQEASGEACLRLLFQRAADDLLLTRLARCGFIHMNILRNICDFYTVMPDFSILGIKSQTQYYAHLLRDSSFCIGINGDQTFLYPRNAIPAGAVLVEPPEPAEPQEILAHAIGLPDGYTHEKAEEWRQYFKEHADSLNESRNYLHFFERNNIIQFNGESTYFLPKAQYKQTVLSKLDHAMRKARCTVEDEDFKTFVKNL